MKTLTLMAIYIASFILIFLMLSSIGWLFTGSYIDVINNDNWQIAYSLILGWWLAFFPSREYYIKYESYFDTIL
jgi:hypothetical protein